MAEFSVVAASVPFPGVSEWFRHGAAVGLWDFRPLVGEVDAGWVAESRADVVLLGAWHPVYEDVVDRCRVVNPDRRILVAWSSSAFEMEEAEVEIMYALAVQRNIVRADGERRLVDGAVVLSKSVASFFRPAVSVFPAPIAFDVGVESLRRSVGERVGVGLYCPPTKKKNILASLLAVRELQDFARVENRPVEEWRLFTNLESYKPVLDGLGLDYVLEGWVSREAHLKRLAERRVVLSPSHGESWCYGAVDAMMVGVPVVGSPTIGWLPEAWRVLNPNDVSGIVACARRLASGVDVAEPVAWLDRVAGEQNALARQAVAKLVAGEPSNA